MDIEELHILKYLEGTLSDDERISFETKLEKSPSLQQEVEDIRFLINAVDKIQLLHNVKTIEHWKKISFKLSLLKLKDKIAKSFQILTMAVFFPLLIVFFIGGRMLLEKNIAANELIEVKSAYGLVSKIILPDSSQVYLNSGSTLVYPRSFSNSLRSVNLNGEAYFIVKANPDKQFEVKLDDNLSVCAYGTEFNINSYEDQNWISTVLVNGNISVNKQIGETSFNVIQPGQIAIYNRQTKNIDVMNTNLTVATAWKDGKIVFRRAKMPEIIYRLSKHFNVIIELKDEALKEYEFSATFTTESLTEILNLIKKASPIKWHYVEPKQKNDESYTKRKVIISLI